VTEPRVNPKCEGEKSSSSTCERNGGLDDYVKAPQTSDVALPSLRELSLRFSRIGDAGAARLGSALGEAACRSLSISIYLCISPSICKC